MGLWCHRQCSCCISWCLGGARLSALLLVLWPLGWGEPRGGGKEDPAWVQSRPHPREADAVTSENSSEPQTPNPVT